MDLLSSGLGPALRRDRQRVALSAWGQRLRVVERPGEALRLAADDVLLRDAELRGGA